VKSSNLLYRVLLVVGLTVMAVVCLIPTLVPNLPDTWKGLLPDRRVHLGLDLQGGTHLVLTVDVAKAIESALERNLDDVKREATEAKVGVEHAERRGNRLVVGLTSADSRTPFTDLIKERFPNLAIETSSTVDSRPTFELAFTKREEQHLRDFALEQSLETIRNRIDQFGVTEPTIQRQGTQDILVQLPGIQDPQRAKDLIGRTAQLEFKLLSTVPDADNYVAGTQPLPAGTQVLSGEPETGTGRARRVQYLVESKTLMTGDTISDATVRPATQMEGPYVALELNARGAKLFEELTSRSVGRRLAIVLDNTVYSAPVIRERIGGGRASITGNFDIKEARDLAIVLRAGALPAPVSIAEERTVGPSLGKDSIRQGITSFLVGGGLVIVFMLFYYKFAGVLADMALILNVVFLVAVLAAFQATLTLPGLAGIVLTLGMAVDANVLINERIREELRLGKTARAAIENGYERALPAILDSNITTFLSGLILFQFGSGPVKGFAVTLCIGIVTTVFTAVFCTRVVYDYLLSSRQIRTVSV
jgi:preprotein translocase subunit SecD